MAPKYLIFVLLSHCTTFDSQYTKIKQTVKELKLAAYSVKEPKDAIEDVQRLVVKLAFEIEELDGK